MRRLPTGEIAAEAMVVVWFEGGGFGGEVLVGEVLVGLGVFVWRCCWRVAVGAWEISGRTCQASVEVRAAFGPRLRRVIGCGSVCRFYGCQNSNYWTWVIVLGNFKE